MSLLTTTALKRTGLVIITGVVALLYPAGLLAQEARTARCAAS